MANMLEDWWKKGGDQWNAWFRSGGGGGGSQEFGGLSPEDEAFKKMLYDQFGELPDYEAYTGDRYADRSPEELALLKQAQEGHPMFDAASKDLGFTQQAYKDAAGYGVDELDADTAALMEGDTYRNEVSDMILRNMNRGASMSGMDITGNAWGSDAGGTHSRGGTGGTARLQSNLGYHQQAGDALSKLHYGAYRDAQNRARTLQQDKLGAAGMFGQTALTNLGIGKDKFGSRLGAYRDDRAYQDKDLDVAYQDWKSEKEFPWKKLSFGSNMFSGMPIEEKGMTQQPASGGK